MRIKNYIKLIVTHVVLFFVLAPCMIYPNELGDCFIFVEGLIFLMYPVFSMLVYRKYKKILVPQILLWITALSLCVVFCLGKWGGTEMPTMIFTGSLNALFASLLLVAAEKSKNKEIYQETRISKYIFMLKIFVAHFVLTTVFYICQWCFFSFVGLPMLVMLMVFEAFYTIVYGVLSVKYTKSIFQAIIVHVFAILISFVLPLIIAIILQGQFDFLLWKIKICLFDFSLFLLSAIITKCAFNNIKR